MRVTRDFIAFTFWALITLSLATSVVGEPRILGISPASGPVLGGTEVTIQGSGFIGECDAPCERPWVYFGGVPAIDVRLVDQNTITAITPPHIPERVTVERLQEDGAEGFQGFEYFGDAADIADRILLPVYLPPIDGAHGSRFETTLLIRNASDTAIRINGLEEYDVCRILCPDPLYVRTIDPGELFWGGSLFAGGNPGIILYTERGKGQPLSFALRVQDVTRQLLTWGTEIPIVREHDLRTGRMELLGIPMDPRFRQTLRIYAIAPTDASLVVRLFEMWGLNPHSPLEREILVDTRRHVEPSSREVLYPGYAQIDLDKMFPELLGQRQYRIEIEPVTDGLLYWSFVSVTNNDTQHITVVSP